MDGGLFSKSVKGMSPGVLPNRPMHDKELWPTLSGDE